MTLRVAFRAANSPGKNRPPFYSHRLALLSLLRALEAYEGERHLTFINDGEIPDDRLSLMKQWADEIVSLPGLGNPGSYRQAIAYLERTAADEDLVFVAEDDHLYRPEAFRVLGEAARELPQVDYFSLYATPGYHGRDDRDRRHPVEFTAGGRAWRTMESATFTYAARMHALREDSWIHWLSSRTPYPDDRRTWLVTQGLGDYRMLTAAADVDLPAWDGLLLRHVLKGVLRGHRRRRRLLIAPVEPVASHGEQGVLAPGTDWEGVARETEEWAAGTGVAGEE